MIKQAIIPLAGLGTRMLPLTSVMPKELLPINGKPNLEYILEECLQAGIKQFIFIISTKKKNIKKYFYNDKFYQKIIKKKKDKRIQEEFNKIKKYRKMIKFVYQNKPNGTGDAVLRCKKHIKGNYFLMLLPDDLIVKNNCTKEMINLHKQKKCSIIATKKVPQKTVSRWGILSLRNKKKNYFEITNVVEKPKLNKAESNYAIIGRYILPKIIMNEIIKLKPGQGNEIHITDAIRNLIQKGNRFYGNIFKGKYLDCGTLSGYINSSIEISKDLK
ncbi:MAG: UTP--glucose-1-phosphate uridylyltransferase [Candidatus Pelagibacter sp.]|nr:UTP--glucose-1-phosphate uridylyltransferase [Candidatus Pelagibacter sp.]OUW68023.1 MAG: UTP--glucose-1-phosphate uridylyltransferase [Candidatus Pelagibacter sp. TMED202]|tara:strand:- start:1994 stop:2812 length:819 start_codon:yes stop_codon:yes gene_type:complete